MIIDEQLINKKYYKTLIEGMENVHPIKALGELYNLEQKEAVPELSYIRFAQGEVYFIHHDYEAAIFKWENIQNELEPWAKKNMADAYFELDLLSSAEDLYQTIHTESDVLKTEVLLQLFATYIARGKLDSAGESIKEVIAFNPDYKNVTSLAQEFFEEHQDWKNAIELAVNEAVRTGNLRWFDTLESYIVQGKTKKLEPNYFSEALVTLFPLDLARFENLASALWNHYRHGDEYFTWIKEINHILLHMEGGSVHSWRELSALYHDTYFEIISGMHMLKDISHLVPNHLTNWLKLSDSTHQLTAAASTLAWSEIFPSSIGLETINIAEEKMSHPMIDKNGLADSFELFQAVTAWARKNGIEIGYRFEWMVKELLDLHASHLLIAGVEGVQKSNLINGLLGENLIDDYLSTTVVFKDNEKVVIQEISDEGEKELQECSNIEENAQTVILYKKPLPYLRHKRLAFIDTPGITGLNRFRNDVFQYLQLADGLLFVLNPKHALTEEELEIVLKFREQSPELPIHFVLNSIYSDEVTQEIIDIAASKVNTYFPEARLFAFSGHEDQLDALANFFIAINGHQLLEEKRTAKVQHYIRKTIKFLLERRVEMEEGYVESIKWNEEMVTKLNGATNQVHDLEEEKILIATKAFAKMKDEKRAQLIEDIPVLLRECSELITEDSDFGKIHTVLNNEMNSRIRRHLDEVIMPSFHKEMHQWISDTGLEFNQAQTFFDEMGQSFNDLYEKDKLTFAGDFKVLEDWSRDADRMTRGSSQFESINILNRFSPSQFLLKSAGKLLGGVMQNKSMLYNKYKQYIENEDYREVAAVVTDQFFQPFELFEKSIDRDVSMFFSPSFHALTDAVNEAVQQIQMSKESLREMRENPELYRDPITLFQIKLLQLEWMTSAGNQIYQN
ncbi:GTP-binding protein [Cytobacillus depressus]|uniref:GTP-binding protein n=1 Tax=Cytobacillus depressus TaxID=1602942 RepID=A0A6L3V2I6_9BACI|nr:GTP-binding protein [Cytobacillus depressus]KAB2331126.1 GTP-binding protein [Cytobacillus depressus]